MTPRRNEACPCGSGKRYKACCGLTATAPDPQAHYRQGNAALAAGQWAAAIAAYDAALQAAPDLAEAWLNRGIARMQAGAGAGGLADYAEAARLAPRSALIWHNYGCALEACGRTNEAVHAYQQAIAGDGAEAQAQAHTNLAQTYQRQGDVAAARRHLHAALQLAPRLAPALHNLAVLCQGEGQLDEARHWLQQALAAHPQFAEAYASLGSVCLDQMQLSAAEQALTQALALRPGTPGWHWNRAMARLLQGRWREGWQDYAWGLPAGRRQLLAASPLPFWQGEPLAGRRLCVIAEQGLGDTLQFFRYLRLLPANTTLVCQPALLPLLQGQGVAVTGAGSALPEADLQVPLLSLPAYLAPEQPPAAPYLTVSAADTDPWLPRLAGLPPGRRIGLAWAGNPNNEADRRRSMAAAELEPLRQLPDVQWISLQIDQPVPAWMHHWGCPFRPTAGLMMHLDAVVAVDSSLLHLAGALGVRSYLLNRWDSDWRWQASGATTPWYSSVHILRQPQAGDWAGVMAQVVQALG